MEYFWLRKYSTTTGIDMSTAMAIIMFHFGAYPADTANLKWNSLHYVTHRPSSAVVRQVNLYSSQFRLENSRLPLHC